MKARAWHKICIFIRHILPPEQEELCASTTIDKELDRVVEEMIRIVTETDVVDEEQGSYPRRRYGLSKRGSS